MLVSANVKSSYRASSLLTGRDGQKVPKYVVDNPEQQVQFRATLTQLYKLSQWASVEYKLLANDEETVPDRLEALIKAFSRAWRSDKLAPINKLHVVEAHLANYPWRMGCVWRARYYLLSNEFKFDLI